ncbi:hypothetical protein K0M31_005422 [Melipona bicolor]|uniref:Uncharacterized protein n=1 Tax=Melipona bicolor TaxID=60889 RepID=A0AA40FVC0_9HYME|nr:hypothetical protein K0M31_005422 [Melipona bicolor]
MLFLLERPPPVDPRWGPFRDDRATETVEREYGGKEIGSNEQEQQQQKQQQQQQ